MPVHEEIMRVATRGHSDMQDITPQVNAVVARSKLRTGVVSVSGRGSTLAITTLEFEPGCVSDFKRALENIVPTDVGYAHNARWGDDNGYAHLRSALIGTAKVFPLSAGRLAIGTWQQIVLCDFDNRARDREITVTVVGE